MNEEERQQYQTQIATLQQQLADLQNTYNIEVAGIEANRALAVEAAVAIVRQEHEAKLGIIRTNIDTLVANL
jgi:hypothetical protein